MSKRPQDEPHGSSYNKRAKHNDDRNERHHTNDRRPQPLDNRRQSYASDRGPPHHANDRRQPQEMNNRRHLPNRDDRGPTTHHANDGRQPQNVNNRRHSPNQNDGRQSQNLTDRSRPQYIIDQRRPQNITDQRRPQNITDQRHPQNTTDQRHPQNTSDRRQTGNDGRQQSQTVSKPATNSDMSVPDYNRAAMDFPASKTAKASMPAYKPFKISEDMPDIPVLTPEFADAPFRHKSTFGYDRTSTASDMTYERLEFLGDAYLEVIASRLIFHHFPDLTAGSQSQVRELLVKNETLAELARAYNFEEHLKVADKQGIADAQSRGNRGMNKILGDCFEAYIAAIILGDVEEGFAVAEKWLTALWAPKLLESTRTHVKDKAMFALNANDDPLKAYDPTAKATLQRKILTGGVKLDYKPVRDSVELKGDQLGQNRHYIGVFLTGYGFENKLLGQGEGKNKVEAGNWAAIQALHGEFSELVKKCEVELAEIREARAKLKAEEEAAQQ